MPNVGGTIDLEISVVGGEHAMNALAFRDAHDCGICEVHRQILIFSPQLAHVRIVVAIERRDFDGSAARRFIKVACPRTTGLRI